MSLLLVCLFACSGARSPFSPSEQPGPAPVDTADSGEPEDSGTPAALPLVVLNEALAEDGDEGPDWVELYNLGPGAADLSGWALGDDPDAEAPPWVLPEGLVLSVGDWLVLRCTDGAAANEADFKISASGDDLVLWGPDGSLRDAVELPKLDADEVYARSLDGTGAWDTSDAPTPGASNAAANARRR